MAHVGKVSNCVSQLRKRAKMTQEELGLAVGVTRQTVISIEKGNYVPSVLLAMKIADQFDINVEEVFSYEV